MYVRANFVFLHQVTRTSPENERIRHLHRGHRVYPAKHSAADNISENVVLMWQSYQFLWDPIERLVFGPLSSRLPSFKSFVYLYPLFALLMSLCASFFHLPDLLSVSNNWTGPHSALSHGHISLPASTCLYLLVCLACLVCLRACLPTISFPLAHSRCIHSLVSHRHTCTLSYIARMAM